MPSLLASIRSKAAMRRASRSAASSLPSLFASIRSNIRPERSSASARVTVLSLPIPPVLGASARATPPMARAVIEKASASLIMWVIPFAPPARYMPIARCGKPRGVGEEGGGQGRAAPVNPSRPRLSRDYAASDHYCRHLSRNCCAVHQGASPVSQAPRHSSCCRQDRASKQRNSHFRALPAGLRKCRHCRARRRAWRQP